MAETKWTPGPWSAEGPDMFGDYNIIAQGLTLAVGAVVSNLRPAGEVAANARMAAAAPDLYEALKAAEGHLAETLKDERWHPIGDCPVLNLVRAALAKVSPQETHKGEAT